MAALAHCIVFCARCILLKDPGRRSGRGPLRPLRQKSDIQDLDIEWRDKRLPWAV